jgi:hypothetical protein
MNQSTAPKNGLNALLTPEESVLILIDHPALPVRQPARKQQTSGGQRHDD